MSELLPRNNSERVAFFSTRTSLWNSNATAIGTTTGAVSALEALVSAASDALASQETAHNAAKAATETVNNAMNAMTNSGMAIIEQVRTKARSAGDGVYPLANIPAPAIPSPVGAPGKPTDFGVSLQETGAIDLTWKCPNPAGAGGTIYQIYRRIGGSGDFTYLGGAGEKKFTDATIPAGSSAVTYQLQAVRSTALGEWAQFNVNFGVGSGGTMTAQVTESTPTRLAA